MTKLLGAAGHGSVKARTETRNTSRSLPEKPSRGTEQAREPPPPPHRACCLVEATVAGLGYGLQCWSRTVSIKSTLQMELGPVPPSSSGPEQGRDGAAGWFQAADVPALELGLRFLTSQTYMHVMDTYAFHRNVFVPCFE